MERGSRRSSFQTLLCRSCSTETTRQEVSCSVESQCNTLPQCV
jgi:hypothetical protein